MSNIIQFPKRGNVVSLNKYKQTRAERDGIIISEENVINFWEKKDEYNQKIYEKNLKEEIEKVNARHLVKNIKEELSTDRRNALYLLETGNYKWQNMIPPGIFVVLFTEKFPDPWPPDPPEPLIA
jgi:hypothetical protein